MGLERLQTTEEYTAKRKEIRELAYKEYQEELKELRTRLGYAPSFEEYLIANLYNARAFIFVKKLSEEFESGMDNWLTPN